MAVPSRIDDLRRRVQKDPGTIAFAQLAEECRRTGAFEEAVETCRAGLAIHPNYLSARVTLGRALLELGALEDAHVELSLVLVSAPENLAAIRGLAEIHHRRGELAEALGHYRNALALARNDPDLEQTVADLTHRLEPPLVTAGEDLTLQGMEDELTRHAVAPPAGETVPAPAEVDMPSAAPADPGLGENSDVPPPSPTHLRGLRTVAALDQWLHAVHVHRTRRRA